jgi:hypothetical protein
MSDFPWYRHHSFSLEFDSTPHLFISFDNALSFIQHNHYIWLIAKFNLDLTSITAAQFSVASYRTSGGHQ